MDISKEDLSAAAAKIGISPLVIESLWQRLVEGNKSKQSVSPFSLIIYYVGAFIVLAAMVWFFMRGWNTFGGGGIFLISCAYALFFLVAGTLLWRKHELHIPGGLFVTLAVCMVPLAIYGLELYFGFWKHNGDPIPARLSVDGNWFLMEVGTVVAALIALRFFPFPFLTAPLSLALWFMSMDLASLWYGTAELTENNRQWVALWFGLAMILTSYLIDCRTKQDYSFWGYLFGLIAFEYSLTWLTTEGEGRWLIFGLANLALILISVLIERRVFLIFGAIGVFLYLSHLAYEVFEDSMWFPFALSFLGIAVICLGIFYQRHERALHVYMQNIIPERWRQALLPQKRK